MTPDQTQRQRLEANVLEEAVRYARLTKQMAYCTSSKEYEAIRPKRESARHRLEYAAGALAEVVGEED